MSQPIIEVKNLSKQYKIGVDTTYKTLSGSITDTIRNPIKTLKNYNKQNEVFWALKDINFEVNRGEVVGIIGRNGAGKSTLLKVLSRITHPTEGEIKLRGKVGSLLEVGTGFHPELSGRENIYFNGAILGMKKQEINEKFEEIVKFAEIEKFLDTPVKRYSSGMYVRLAFAVAAHMDPEILIVDEVLAVGDVAFQKKCLGKMGEVAKGGRTVLFVSHNMAAITNLCSRAIHIENGKIIDEGAANNVVNNYLKNISNTSSFSYKCQEKRNNRAWITSATLKSVEGNESGTFLMSEPIIVECILNIIKTSQLAMSVQIKDMNNSPIYHFPNGDSSFVMPSSLGHHLIKVRIPPLNLYPDGYSIQLSLTEFSGDFFKHIHIIENLSFQVQQDYSLCGRQLGRHAGLVFSPAEWSESGI